MSDIAKQLRDLADLVKEGLLTIEEFEEQKRILLGRSRVSVPPSSRPSRPASPPAGRPESHPAVGPADSGRRLGSYTIFEELGQGGMGVVFRARHLVETMAKRQGGDVALKVMHPHLARDQEFRSWFENEAALGLKLRHPSVVKVHEILIDGDTLGLVMSLIQGRPLRDLITQGGLDLEKVLGLLEPLAEAIDHIHAQGIIHRDLKPENIRIAKNGQPVLLDFGIAKDTHRSTGTTTGAGLGTIAYMAPEQYLDAKRVSSAADRYALGMLAYELILGKLPWPRGSSEYAVMRAKETGELPPLSSLLPGLAPRTSQAVTRMLSVRPASRFKSAAEFVGALAPKPPKVSHHSTGSKRYHYHGPWGHRKGMVSEIARWIASAPRERHLIWKPGWPGWRPWQAVPDVAALVQRQLPTPDPVETRSIEGVSFKLVHIEEGTFWMGSPDVDEEAFFDEKPRHQVTLTRSYKLATTAVTQELYQVVSGRKVPKFSVLDARCPVEMISWYDAVRFCNQLSRLEGLKPAYEIEADAVHWDRKSGGYRLPTEAEWEYAARSGGSTLYAGASELRNVGWYASNSAWRAHPVAQKGPNALGLYDMSGNVWEWVWDRYGRYPDQPTVDPVGPTTGKERIKRGGSWWNLALYARVGLRVRSDPTYRYGPLGFRLARSC